MKHIQHNTDKLVNGIISTYAYYTLYTALYLLQKSTTNVHSEWSNYLCYTDKLYT